MSHPERNDTDPMGGSTLEDTDPLGASTIEDTLPDGIEEAPTHDSEFFKWLPTVGNAFRRRRELVERSSSDGAAFAAYATAARPAAAASRPTQERAGANVRVVTDAAGRDAPGSRDALTVVIPGRVRRTRAAVLGLGVVAALAVTMAVAGASYLSASRQARATLRAQGAVASSGATEHSVDPVAIAATPGLKEETVPALAGGTASATTSGAERTLPANPDLARKREHSAPAKAAESPPRRSPRPTPSATSLAKDQFFEDQ